MAITVKRQAAIPPGAHKGIVINAEETSKVFDPATGPEETVEITIQPAWKQDAKTETLPVSVLFSPVLNGLSGLSACLQRLGKHPSEGESFDVVSLIGTEVAFTAEKKGNFIRVVKDSIRAA